MVFSPSQVILFGRALGRLSQDNMEVLVETYREIEWARSTAYILLFHCQCSWNHYNCSATFSMVMFVSACFAFSAFSILMLWLNRPVFLLISYIQLGNCWDQLFLLLSWIFVCLFELHLATVWNRCLIIQLQSVDLFSCGKPSGIVLFFRRALQSACSWLIADCHCQFLRNPFARLTASPDRPTGLENVNGCMTGSGHAMPRTVHSTKTS